MNLGNRKEIVQNLKDAGCSDEFIDEFFNISKKNKSEKPVIKLLYNYKKFLLKDLHDSQKKIDCLDFLIFKINQAVKE